MTYLLDLLSQLTSRREKQCLALADADVDLLEDRDREGRGLTGSRLRLRNHIVA